tara:strand:- start:473 stop:1240 length:768 start_codon:yes stop_codon:yes gene_type:complete
MQVEGSVFLVTGGASGLGAATARMIVRNSGSVLIADLNESEGQNLASELGSNARFVRTDVTSEASTQAAVKEAVNSFGKLNGVVCCAGIAPGEKVLNKGECHNLENFTNCMMVNLVGTFNPARLGAKAISETIANEEGERGIIIFTASVAAFEGQIGQAAYSASKAGLVGMTLPMARELARYGIRVMTIAPGIFETPMLKGLPVEVQDSLGQMVPFPSRLGRGDEYGQLVKSICENSMLNGEVIRLDGAIRMASK